MTDQQADKLSAHLFRSFAGDSAFSGVKEALRLPPSIIREMWRSPRGREAARKIAFREVALPDNLRLPAVLGATELARQTAFGGQWTDQQEELVWTVAAETFDLQNAGKLSAAQALNLAMTWKGLTNFLGWGGLAPTLDPVYRSKVAYLFAHRYLALGKREEATRFRQTVLTDSPPDSQAYRLASQEAEQFEAK
jgi:hypothetical protein